jgi:hypothetical protein
LCRPAENKYRTAPPGPPPRVTLAITSPCLLGSSSGAPPRARRAPPTAPWRLSCRPPNPRRAWGPPAVGCAGARAGSGSRRPRRGPSSPQNSRQGARRVKSEGRHSGSADSTRNGCTDRPLAAAFGTTQVSSSGDNNTFTMRRHPPARRSSRPPGRTVAKPRSPPSRPGTLLSPSLRSGAPLLPRRLPRRPFSLGERGHATTTHLVTPNKSMPFPAARSNDRQGSSYLFAYLAPIKTNTSFVWKHGTISGSFACDSASSLENLSMTNRPALRPVAAAGDDPTVRRLRELAAQETAATEARLDIPRSQLVKRLFVHDGPGQCSARPARRPMVHRR